MSEQHRTVCEFHSALATVTLQRKVTVFRRSRKLYAQCLIAVTTCLHCLKVTAANSNFTNDIRTTLCELVGMLYITPMRSVCGVSAYLLKLGFKVLPQFTFEKSPLFFYSMRSQLSSFNCFGLQICYLWTIIVARLNILLLKKVNDRRYLQVRTSIFTWQTKAIYCCVVSIWLV